jgi:hypothetical protein
MYSIISIKKERSGARACAWKRHAVCVALASFSQLVVAINRQPVPTRNTSSRLRPSDYA